MKKLIVILTVAMLIVLSGCSTKNESSVEEAVEETSPEKSGRIADDCNIRSMNITAPKTDIEAAFVGDVRFPSFGFTKR